MDPTPNQQAALCQLGAVPGVVGSMVFDPAGAVVLSEFPGVFDAGGLRQLAAQLSASSPGKAGQSTSSLTTCSPGC